MYSAKVLVIILIVCAVVCVSIGMTALMKAVGMYDHRSENIDERKTEKKKKVI